jgi:hypothetical protein
MVTAEELTVAIKSEGVGETRDDIEGIERSMEETAEATGDSAEKLEGFSENLAGVASAAVAGLAVATAGILSQVPILRENFAALGAIVDAFAFRLDGVLRPALTGINQVLFEFANAVFNAEGPLGVLADAVSVLVPLLGIGGGLALGIAKIVAVLNALGVTAITVSSVTAQLSGILGVLAGVASSVAGAIQIFLAGFGKIVLIIGSVISGISATTAALAVLAAAVVGFAAAYITNFKGVRDTTNRVLGNALDTFVSFAGDLTEWAGNLASDAFNWGRNLVQGFINGIQSLIGRVRSFLGDLRDVGGSVGISVPSLGGALGGGGGGGGGGGNVTRSPFGGSGIGRRAQIDGRTLTESTGRYRSDPSRRRGL